MPIKRITKQKLNNMKRRFFTFVSLLFIAITSVFAQDPLVPGERFYFEVSGYDGANKTTVKAIGYNDWSFEIKLPAKESYIGAGQIDIFARLTDIDALDIVGSKEYSKTLTSDIAGSIQLENHFGYLYNFYEGTTFPITVVDEDGSDNAVLNVVKSGNVITGTTDPAAADACSKRIMKHGAKIMDEGTFGMLPGGSWIKFGNEQLKVNSNIELDLGSSISSALDNITDATTLVAREFDETNAADQEKETYVLKAFIPMGAIVSFKGHQVILQDNCYITIDASEAYYGNPLENWISELRNASGKENKVKMLFEKINNIFAIFDECTVPVEIKFGDSYSGDSPSVIDVYYSDYEEGLVKIEEQTVEQFNAILEDYPNAIGIVDYENETLVDKADKNLVVEYPVGHNSYFECVNFELTDKVDFYTPVDFVAVNGSYTREPNTKSVSGAFYNSVCLPFAFSGSDLSSTAQILTFSFYEEKDGDRNIYFNQKTTIPAANPCIVYDEADTWNKIEFDNTPIYATPDNSGNMQGTFVKTNAYAGTHYSVNVQNKFAKLQDTLTAFRSCLSLDPGVIIPESEEAKMNIIIIDEAAGIESVKAEANNSNVYYNLQGMRMANTVKGGIYINNGKKIIIK